MLIDFSKVLKLIGGKIESLQVLLKLPDPSHQSRNQLIIRSQDKIQVLIPLYFLLAIPIYFTSQLKYILISERLFSK